ncbi:MAG: 6,7-dimethyl-8-ribityllumazine synthase [Candidatus Omnitrophota bacterium]
MAAGNLIKGDLIIRGKKFGIAVSRFNEFVSSKLVDGAVDALTRHGVKESEITTAWVPGSFELPVIAQKMASSGKFDAVLCLGVVIRGETPHFDFVASETAKGVAKVAMESDIPCVFGVVTADNLEQAIDRAGLKSGNKGRDAALAAIELCNLYSEIGKKK